MHKCFKKERQKYANVKNLKKCVKHEKCEKNPPNAKSKTFLKIQKLWIVKKIQNLKNKKFKGEFKKKKEKKKNAPKN